MCMFPRMIDLWTNIETKQTYKKHNNPNLLHYTKLRSFGEKKFLDRFWSFLILTPWQLLITNILQTTSWVKSK